MGATFDSKKIQSVLDKIVDEKNIFSAGVNLRTKDAEQSFGAGFMQPESQYYIASVTKLFVTAIVLSMLEQQEIKLDDPISKYIPQEWMDGLHKIKDTDYSAQITIQHLISHTSGLPDYFEGKRPVGRSLFDELKAGRDEDWTTEDAVVASKSMKPHFPPGQRGKAHYSDTNFQLLGKILEDLSGNPLEELIDEKIVQPLELSKTYLFVDPKDNKPVPFHYKDSGMYIPGAMSSFRADGGMVSTTKECNIFLEAFFEGKLFDKEHLPMLYQWNSIFMPFQYGLGVARLKIPRVFSPLKAVPELLGHPGSTGSFAYYCPDKDLYLSGTLNQVNNPGQVVRFVVKLLNMVK